VQQTSGLIITEDATRRKEELLGRFARKYSSGSLGDIFTITIGEFHDQGDTKWILIRGQLRSHNDTRSGGQPPADLSAAQGLAPLML
jgi:hypothetical protein